MKIAVVSDFHLGFASGSKRSEDALMQARQAFEIAVSEGVDCILMAGDFFDEEVPKQETWHDAFELLEIPLSAEKSRGKLSIEKSGKSEGFGFEGIPVIAIHGTHEHRSKGYKNALDVLQKAGVLLHLHAAKAIVEKASERVCVFGLGGVPEKHAKDALKVWNPLPEKGALNVLMLHQSFVEFLPFDDEMTATLSLADLPKGFDFVINGHLHWSLQKQLGTTVFLMPGSTITTQLKNSECAVPKGFYLLNSESKALSFVRIPEQRRMFYSRLKFENSKPAQVLEKIEETIRNFLARNDSKLEPLIRVKCAGSLAKGFSSSDVNLAEVEGKFSGKALLSLDKAFESDDFKKTISELRELQSQRKSLSALGLEMLEKRLLETSFDNAFDVKRVFELLSEGKTEEVEKILKVERKS